MGRKLTCWWFLVGALSACRSIDIDPVGGGGSAVQGGAPPAGAAGAGGTPAEGGSGGQAPPCELCGGDVCIDLATDPESCGVCGETCLLDCEAGACVISENDGVHDVDYSVDHLYWVGASTVSRSFGGINPPDTINITSRSYYDLEVQSERVYLTYVNENMPPAPAPPVYIPWATPVVETLAACPGTLDCSGVQLLTASDVTLWTSPSGVYFRSTTLMPVPSVADPVLPGLAISVAASTEPSLYAYGDFTHVYIADLSLPIEPIDGFDTVNSIAFAGTTFFAGDKRGVSCGVAAEPSQQLIVDAGPVASVLTTPGTVFAVMPSESGPDLLVRIPGVCSAVPLEGVEIVASSGACRIGGLSSNPDGERIYWSQYGGAGCAGVFSRRTDAFALGTLADP